MYIVTYICKLKHALQHYGEGPTASDWFSMSSDVLFEDGHYVPVSENKYA